METLIFLPEVLMTGCWTCGGDTTTFSLAFSNFTYSSNDSVTLPSFTFRAPRAGVLPMNTGGVSSNGPPSGLPMDAQLPSTAIPPITLRTLKNLKAL